MGYNKQVSELNEEGRFLGFVGEEGDRRKRLRIATGEGECCIKLKLLTQSWVSLYAVLTPGEWVRVLGEKKVNLKTGEVKLKAYFVIPATASDSLVHGRLSAAPPTPVPPPAPVSQMSSQPKASILVCQKSDCRKRGGAAVCAALAEALSDRGLEELVTIKETGCMKQCKAGPNIVVMPDKTRYTRIDPEEIPQIIEKHFCEKSTPQGECYAVVGSGA